MIIISQIFGEYDSVWHNYLERMLFVDLSVNYQPIFMKFGTAHFQVLS